MAREELWETYARLADVNPRLADAARAISLNSLKWSEKLDLAIQSLVPLSNRDFPRDLGDDFAAIMNEVGALKRARNGSFVDSPQRCKKVAIMVVELHNKLTWSAIFALHDAVDEIGKNHGA